MLDTAQPSAAQTQPSDARRAATWLIAAAALFWLAWACMPGVGITDATRILTLVGTRRDSVRLSVALQLASAACYAPALVYLTLHARTLLAQRAGAVHKAAAWLGLAAFPVLPLAAALPEHGRTIGLTVLGCIAGAQAFTGYGLALSSHAKTANTRQSLAHH